MEVKTAGTPTPHFSVPKETMPVRYMVPSMPPAREIRGPPLSPLHESRSGKGKKKSQETCSEVLVLPFD